MRKRNLAYNTDDTIVAVSTPLGEGGIGIVRLSGRKALSIADKIFASKDKSKPSEFKTYTTHYGYIIRHASLRAPTKSGRNNPIEIASSPSAPRNDRNRYAEIIDEVILTVMRAPKSYTTEDVVEINCHGGIVPLRRVLDLTLSHGARLAQPGEFTKRAFINGRIDLTQAEAVLDIIRSRTDSFMKVALGHLEGGLSNKIRSLKEKLLDILSELEARIDFSEDDIELMPKEDLSKKLDISSVEIKKLIDDAWKGMILKEGIMCVICGKPNAGKSSLMNTLLRRSRVIVTPVPGTTRDAIEEEINLKGIPIRVVDTAGISEARDIVEKHGIRKSKSYIKLADIILFVLDLSKRWSRMDEKIFNDIKSRKFIIIANKSDLPVKLDLNKVKKMLNSKPGKPEDEIIEISMLRKRNLDRVEDAILKKIWHGEIPHPEGAFVTNLRHRKDLEAAHKCIREAIKALEKKSTVFPEIVASEVKEAVFFLNSILGDAIEPDILDRIFSKFCIGK
ncbi:MAG: tRNA uridine-5-carboxymethylaminomethyl(34) synthesis GTPase MnmE [Candidatus Omnitrophota bacterium]|nr:MAG: tRNA uridine-5-carboxymethylaminomethyl(34) synthesis GTPase MnmE [Candidatus Omnitrophota bacterium]